MKKIIFKLVLPLGRRNSIRKGATNIYASCGGQSLWALLTLLIDGKQIGYATFTESAIEYPSNIKMKKIQIQYIN